MRSHLAGIANYSGETYSDKRRLTRNLKLSRYHHPILIEDRRACTLGFTDEPQLRCLPCGASGNKGGNRRWCMAPDPGFVVM